MAAVLMEEKGPDKLADPERSRKEALLHQAAYDQLSELSFYLMGEKKPFERPEQIKTFCARLKFSLTVLLREFKELLKGRKLFQKQYATFATGPQSGTQIFRVEEREREIGPYLFNWDKPEESAVDLEKALSELKYHQLAFLSGFRASVKEGTRELLRPLDPQAIEAELSRKSVSVAGLKIPFKLAPFKHKLLWREYRRRVEELLHLEDQQLEGKFRPHFRQGYVGFMAAKPESKDENV